MRNLTRGVVLSFRLSQLEADLVRVFAAWRGWTFSRLVRELLLDAVQRDAVQRLERDKGR